MKHQSPIDVNETKKVKGLGIFPSKMIDSVNDVYDPFQNPSDESIGFGAIDPFTIAIAMKSPQNYGEGSHSYIRSTCRY